MTTLAIGDALGLSFTLACILVWAVVTLLYLVWWDRLKGGPARRLQQQRARERHQGKTRVGIDSPGPFDELARAREQRVARAHWRHSTRHSRRAS